MSYQTFSLTDTGWTREGRSFQVDTKSGYFAGMITENFKTKVVRVYFNGNCTKGSAVKFSSIAAACEYLVARRIKKNFKF